MSFRRIAFIVGTALATVGIALASPLLIAVLYREWDDVVPLLLSIVVTMAAGLVIRRSTRGVDDITTREAFAAVALTWFAVITFGALPYLTTGSLGSVTDAIFESASGFTATGSTVVADPANLSHGVLFWRSLSQWLGGMGVVVLVVALLPRLGVGAIHLIDAEAPGPSAERITPRLRDTARTLWILFVGFTALESLLLILTGMVPFDAVTHSFTTVAGGGFGTDAHSMEAFSAAAQWIVVVFMIVGGTSFVLHYRGLRRPIEYVRSAEFRLYIGFVVVASAFVVVGTWGGAIADTVRDATFTVTSIVTTTGFVTADYGTWAPPLHILLIGLMFVGAMSGSTSGSIKVFRLEVMARSIRAIMRNLVHPRSVRVTSAGGKVLDPATVRSIGSFFLLYVLTFLGATIALGVIELVGGTGDLGLVTTTSAVATTLGNIGPGLEVVGPTTTFALIPDLGKWLLAFVMVVGRLEILPVMMLLNREAWRR
jgi:trk system potassium uptake protein TrkH